MKEELITIPKSEYERLKTENSILSKGFYDIALRTSEITLRMNEDWENYKKEFDL